MPTGPELAKLIETLQFAKDQKTFHKLRFFRPYMKQQEFMNAGAHFRERLLIAANQVGKSYSGAAETAMHLTGEYPVDWIGRQWTRPIKAWAAGESGQVVRDVSQKLLCGEPGVDTMLGTGMIPKDAFVERPSLARGVTDAYDTVQVKHLAPDGRSVDGISVLRFKSYEQGRAKFQGETIDMAWCDEEPSMDVYGEILTRITATSGMVFTTFTPLKGMSEVVRRFLNDADANRFHINMTIDDAEHIPAEERNAIIAGYPEYQREARANGVPMQGEGLVFPYPQSLLAEPTIEYVPAHWTKLWSIDFGIAHNFAAVLMAWDKDADCLHVLHTVRMGGQQGSVITPLQHAAAMKAYAANIPVAWPHDGNNREKGSGETLAAIYKREPNGLLMLPGHTTFPDGGYSFEGGIAEMQTRMETGQFKVAAHLNDWFEEQRNYHRENGLVVKLHDDLMSASRVGVMGRRFGKPLPLVGGVSFKRRRETAYASGVDFDLS